jgi:PAS domain-containing protein
VAAGVPSSSVLPIAQVRQDTRLVSSNVRIQGVVTGFSGWQNSFFVQDNSDGISVDGLNNTDLSAGDLVELTGTVNPGMFAPILMGSTVHVLRHHAALPPAIPLRPELISNGKLDSKFVEAEGVIQAARLDTAWGRSVLLLDLRTPAGLVAVHVVNPDNHTDVSRLLDSTVKVEGICGTIFNDRKQMTGLRLFVQGSDPVAILHPGIPVTDLPFSAISNLLRFRGPSIEHRVKVAGTITYQISSTEFLLQGTASSIQVRSETPGVWTPGLQVHAAGYVSDSGGLLSMGHAVVHALGMNRNLAPLDLNAEKAFRQASGFSDAPFNGLLVRTAAVALRILPTGDSDVLQLRAGTVDFEVQLPPGLSKASLAFEEGSRVRVTGVFLASTDDLENPRSFRILLRSAKDVEVQQLADGRSSLFLLLALIAFVSLAGFGSLVFYRREQGDILDVIETAEVSHLRTALAKIARALGIVGSCFGGILLASWLFEFRWFQSWQLMPNAVVGILAGSLSIAVLDRTSRLAKALRFGGAILCTTVGVLTAIEYATGHSFGIDYLLIWHKPFLPGALFPGRMAVATSLCLASSGIALLCISWRRAVALGQILATASAVVALLKVLAGLYGAHLRFGIGGHATMSSTAAPALLLLNVAILFSRADRELMRTIVLPGSGGIMLRRLVPVGIAAPVILGWLQLQGQIAGLFDTRFGVALYALGNVICFAFLIWSCSIVLNRFDRQRAASSQAVRNRERHLELVFQTAFLGEFNWNILTDEVTAHPVVWKLYGEPNRSGSAPSSWFRSRQHPEDVPIVEKQMAEALGRKAAFDIEFRIAQPDGSFRWICRRGRGIYSNSGQLLQIYGINFDVTQRKEAELRVRDSEEMFRRLADSMPQIVWTAGPDGIIDYYNKRWYDYVGSAFRTSWEELIHPDDVNAGRSLYHQCVAEGTPYEM